ncbi:MAG: GCN5-related N-acetyltransferase [Chloroflexi bacterium]|nr:MAG: GCN5-related N-acetyltransferase [Chloroflexota bacterium]MBA4375360.1 hypothetical protein [Anaerolinea sp.]
MDPSLQIRQATNADTSEIAELLSRSPHVHRHLDWQAVLDWLPNDPFLVIRNESCLLGLLACPPDPEYIAWIRCFACTQDFDLKQIWTLLINSVINSPSLTGSTLYSVGLNNWFSNLLANSGFINFQNIVVLKWNQRIPQPKQIASGYLVRPMESHDIQDVALLDKLAFEAMWVNSADKIALAYYQAEHALVAEIDGEIIGYELSTANHFSAHLARIAIHPKHQREHIGSNLVTEMFKYFHRRGIYQITVNTQDDNTSSLNLYQSLGFIRTGESFPVYRYPLE